MKTTREVFRDIWHLMSIQQKLQCIWWHERFRFWCAFVEFGQRRMSGINYSMERSRQEATQ